MENLVLEKRVIRRLLNLIGGLQTNTLSDSDSAIKRERIEYMKAIEEAVIEIITANLTAQVNQDKQIIMDSYDLYDDIDCVVIPSRGEGFGLIPFEALQCGVPIITTENLGSDEYLDKLEENKGKIMDPMDQMYNEIPPQ